MADSTTIPGSPVRRDTAIVRPSEQLKSAVNLAADFAPLVEFARRFPGLPEDPRLFSVLLRLSGLRHRWVRPLGTWYPPELTGLPREDVAGKVAVSLADHLLARYPVPGWMRYAWRAQDEQADAALRWYLHVTAGRNLRHAPGLPFPLTRRMAHIASMHTPRWLRPFGALRYAQLMAQGVTHRPAANVVARHTRLSERQADEPFWLRFAQWYGRHWSACWKWAPLLISYLHARRFGDGSTDANDGLGGLSCGDPTYRIERRSPAVLEEQAHHWQRIKDVRTRLGRALDTAYAHDPAARQTAEGRWPASGIQGFQPSVETGLFGPVEPAFKVVELRSALALQAEGAAMRNCVLDYAPQAAVGTCAIFSLRRLDRGRWRSEATIEVRLREGTIVQARGFENAAVEAADRAVIATWASRQGLTLEHGCFTVR